MKCTLLCAILLFSLHGSAFAQTAITELTAGVPASRELKASEAHNYQLTLTASQTAHIVAAQQGADVAVLVYDPAGKLLIEMDSPNGTTGVESVWLVNQPAGIYRVVVKPFNGKSQGKYEIRLDVLRDATSADARTGEAQDALLAGMRLSQTRDTAGQKAAAAKFTEALRLLGSDGEPSLVETIRLMATAYLPMLRVEQMKLVRVPGQVTVYHSADNAKLAMEKRALLESLLNFYQPLLQTRLELNLVVLNKSDWAEWSGGAPFVIPTFAPEPPTLVQGDSYQAGAAMLGMFKSKVPAELNSALAAEGLSYDTAAPVLLEAGSFIPLGSMLLDRAAGPLPKPWMNAVLTTYLLNAWLGEKQPQLKQRLRLAMQIPGAVMTPGTRALDAMFNSGDPFTAGYSISRAADLGAQLYETHKLRLLAELQKAFPKGEKADAVVAEQRLYKLSPLFKPWVESFGYTGTALEVQQAETALVTARRSKDAAAFDRLVADDYAGLNQNGVQRNKAGFRLSATNAQATLAIFTLDRTDIELSGDIAIVRGAQTEQWEGASRQHHLFTRIWVRRAGRWQLLSNTQFIDPQ